MPLWNKDNWTWSYSLIIIYQLTEIVKNII